MNELYFLAHACLKELRAYWKCRQASEWLFPAKNAEEHLSIGSVQKIYYKYVEIEAVEFIRRFRSKALHVLPIRFTRIRHYGFLANRYKKENIGAIRLLLGLTKELPEVVEKSVQELMLKLNGVDTTSCPFCGKGRMEKRAKIPKHTGRSSFHIIQPAN